jgi:hypothetical protein
MKESFMARALNKNKKPETKNKNRACNYFLGSFGSPCGFRDSENPCGSEPAREKTHWRRWTPDSRIIVNDHRECARSYKVNLRRPTPSPD